MKKWTHIRMTAGIAMVLGLSLAWPASAAVLLEYDFRTAPTGSPPVQTASVSVASNQATLVDRNADGTGAYPIVHTGTALGSTNDYAPEIADGYIAYQGSISESGHGMISRNTAVSGHNNYWVNYFGSGQGMGTGSATVVFRPHDTLHSGRGTFISSGIGDYGYFKLFDVEGHSGNRGNAPTLQMNGVDIDLGGGNPAGIGAWEANTWYVLTASWKTGDAAHLYLQAISPKGTLISASGGNVNAALTASDSYVSHPIAFNASSNADIYWDGPTGYPFPSNSHFLPTFNGDVALYRLTSDYIDTTAEFNTLFNQLVPEPASMSILALAGVALIRRKR